MKTVQAVKSERFLKPAWTDDGKQDITKGRNICPFYIDINNISIDFIYILMYNIGAYNIRMHIAFQRKKGGHLCIIQL